MSAATTEATKSKKKKSATALSFTQLLARVKRAGGKENKEAGLSLLRTAATHGWLTDLEFMTRLTEDEVGKVKEIVKADAEAKKAPLADLTRALPTVVGAMVTEVKPAGNRVRLSSNNKAVMVDALLYETLRKRHPAATVYLNHDDPDGPVIFSERMTVAVLGAVKKLA